MGWLVSVISGIMMSLQGIFNTKVKEQTSLWVSTLWAQLSALLVCFLCWAIAEGTSIWTLKEVTPRYLLGSGILGAGITVTVILGMQWIGPAQATAFIVVAQILFSWLTERFGWFGVEKTAFSWLQLAGVALAILGLLLVRMAGKGE
jgi:transporter family-2 protein